MKKKIVIASILKPVDDVRAYEKIAQSIAKTNKYEVNIIGNLGKKESNSKHITFNTHTLRSNSIIKRILIREKTLFTILTIRPQLLIITTYELINIALLAKLFCNCKVIYDVQENYAVNAKYLSKSILKKAYSFIIKLKEKVSRWFVSEYWLAEACYADQLNFVKNRFSIIENKAKAVSHIRVPKEEIRLLFSGTISNYAGVKNAIYLLRKIQEKHTNASLKIIGQIHDVALEKYLLEKQKTTCNIELNISRNSISHDQIIDAIFSTNLGIIGYEENEINRYKVPTKLYEYSRYQLPFVVMKETHWAQIGMQLGGSIPIDFQAPNIEEIMNFIRNPYLLFTDNYPEVATWEYESRKVIDSIDALFD
jgi:glycosyltransferase involved in cell wall biosynthesis